VHDWSLDIDNPVWGFTQLKRYQQYDTRAMMRLAWESSPDSAIGTWRSPVLLIQGDDDRNVEFHQMVDLVERLRHAGVPFEQIVIPNEIHGFCDTRRGPWPTRRPPIIYGAPEAYALTGTGRRHALAPAKALGLVEQPLTQPNGFRRNLHQLVVGDELDGPLQRKLLGRRQFHVLV